MTFKKLLVGSAFAAALAIPSVALADNDGPVATGGDARISTSDRFAVVNADCTIARGFGAVSCTPSGTGNFVIRFNRNVRKCVYSGTIGLSGASGTEAPGFITVVGAAVDVKGVFVTTDDIAGASAARGFHLAVGCK